MFWSGTEPLVYEVKGIRKWKDRREQWCRVQNRGLKCICTEVLIAALDTHLIGIFLASRMF